MAKSTHRDEGREARWRRIIGRHAGSGVTIRQFCRDNDVAESAFYFWRRELQRRDAQRPQRRRGQGRDERRRQRRGTGGTSRHTAAPAFVPVSISPPADVEDGAVAQTAAIEIVLPGGARVRVGVGGVDRRALADVVAVLQEGISC